MKTQLILLAEPILVSDEEIKEGSWVYNTVFSKTVKVEEVYFTAISLKEDKEEFKVIAGIPELPSITYSDQALETLKNQYGWVDVERLANKLYPFALGGVGNSEHDKKNHFIKGFKAAQSLNEKKFSQEDMRDILNRCEIWWKKEQETKAWFDLCMEIFQSVSQPKVIDVEVEMNCKFINVGCDFISGTGYESTCKKCSIEITKVL